jgi:hypothetical protein
MLSVKLNAGIQQITGIPHTIDYWLPEFPLHHQSNVLPNKNPTLEVDATLQHRAYLPRHLPRLPLLQTASEVATLFYIT